MADKNALQVDFDTNLVNGSFNKGINQFNTTSLSWLSNGS